MWFIHYTSLHKNDLRRFLKWLNHMDYFSHVSANFLDINSMFSWCLSWGVRKLSDFIKIYFLKMNEGLVVVERLQGE